jgi:hypothetical protein
MVVKVVRLVQTAVSEMETAREGSEVVQVKKIGLSLKKTRSLTLQIISNILRSPISRDNILKSKHR